MKDAIGIVSVLVVGGVALGVAAVLLNGFAFYVLWHWFAVPLTGVILTMPEAMAVSLMVGFVTHQSAKSAEGWDAAAYLFLRPFIVLGIGWLILQFM